MAEERSRAVAVAGATAAGSGEPAAHGLDDARLRAFFEVAAEAMAVARDGVHVLANSAFARLFGYDRPEEIVGLHARDLIVSAGREGLDELLRQRRAGHLQPASLEVRGLRRDGSEFTGLARSAGFQEGASTYSVVVIRDVTAERAAERLLAESERRHRELFDEVPVGVWVEDLSGARQIVDGLRAQGVTDLAAHFRAHPEVVLACARSVRILQVNATACAMAGARDQAELLANLDKVFLPEAMEDYAVELLQLAEGRRTTLTEGWNGTLDGRRLWVAVRGVLAEGHEQDWSRLLVITVDLTEQRRVREERAALQEQLRHAEKLEAVGRLAGGVAHDFNNILAGVLGFAEMALEEAVPGTPLHDSQLHIREAALRARDLVRQILTFGRRDRPTQRPLDVPGVVGEALALARAGIPSTVAVEARIDAAAGAAVADPTQLHQIVLNLCSNARDAVGERGRIELSVDAVTLAEDAPDLPRGPYVRLQVRDDGVGMDDATRAHLFEPYLTTKGRSGGHGLGLAVVHGIVAGCGGAIRVESAPGRGSTFGIFLPRVGEAPPVQAPAPARAPGGGEQILLVDDEPMVRKAYRRILQALGYRVIEASDGAEALERVRAAPGEIDLVLTDQTMPRLSGAELARVLHAEQPALPVILCTGYSEVVDERGAGELGVRALLEKPVERSALAAAVRQALRRA